jgi:hypothetical protein
MSARNKKPQVHAMLFGRDWPEADSQPRRKISGRLQKRRTTPVETRTLFCGLLKNSVWM